MKQIQWFPGHMAKARRQVEEKLGLVDIVFELVDARLPEASRNPMMAQIIGKKPSIRILNKRDLADPSETRAWLDFLRSQGIDAIATDANKDDLYALLVNKSREILAPIFQKEAAKGMKERPIRAMVIGIPNVGKSQFINRLAGKNKAHTGNMPGVTKHQTVLKAGKDLELLDNPGILWPKFEKKEDALKLALIFSIKEDILPIDEVVLGGIQLLREYYPDRLEQRYDFQLAEFQDNIQVLDWIGKKRGCLAKGGEVDYDRVYQVFMTDLKEHRFGTMTWEKLKHRV